MHAALQDWIPPEKAPGTQKRPTEFSHIRIKQAKNMPTGSDPGVEEISQTI
jgi:hypothetical protein